MRVVWLGSTIYRTEKYIGMRDTAPADRCEAQNLYDCFLKRILRKRITRRVREQSQSQIVFCDGEKNIDNGLGCKERV